MTNPYNAGIIAGDIAVTPGGPTVATPAPGQHVIVMDGLTPDEVRVITGLVRAMREKRVSVSTLPSNWHLANAMDAMHNDNEVEAAWHIAHAISQMGES